MHNEKFHKFTNLEANIHRKVKESAELYKYIYQYKYNRIIKYN